MTCPSCGCRHDVVLRRVPLAETPHGKRFGEMWLEDAFVETIMLELDICRNTVWDWRRKLGLPPRDPGWHWKKLRGE